MYTITFNFEQKGLPPVTFTRVKPLQTLLELALENNIGLHHDCGGVCACSACHLFVEEGGHHLEKQGRREKDYLVRADGPRMNSRLGCQCLLHDGRGRLTVTLPDQTLNFK